MSHIIPHLLFLAILWLVAKSVRKHAVKTVRGFEGGIPPAAYALPIISGVLFADFGFEALESPKPEIRMLAILWFLVPVCMTLVLLHLWTFRISANEKHLLVQSLFWQDRIIYFDRLFDLKVNKDGEAFHVSQGNTKIKVTRMLDGYSTFLSHTILMHKLFSGTEDAEL